MQFEVGVDDGEGVVQGCSRLTPAQFCVGAVPSSSFLPESSSPEQIYWPSQIGRHCLPRPDGEEVRRLLTPVSGRNESSLSSNAESARGEGALGGLRESAAESGSEVSQEEILPGITGMPQ